MKALGKLLGIVLALVVYGSLGAFMFVYVENMGTEKASGVTFINNETELLFRQLAENYSCLRNLSDDDMNRLALSLVDLKYSNQKKKMWTFNDGLQLVIETLTTIGYGSTPPVTKEGRILIIFYSFVGIPLFMFLLQTVGDMSNSLIRGIIRVVEFKLLQIQEPKNLELKCLIASSFIFISWMSYATRVVARWRGWSYTDALYALYTTLTTIGFGDLMLHLRGHASIVLILCLSLIAAFFNSVVCFLTKGSSNDQNMTENKRCCCGTNSIAVEDS